MELKHTQLQGWIKLNINKEPEIIKQYLTSDTIEALKPILSALQIIDHTCTSEPELNIIITATLKIIDYIVNGVGAHLQNMETMDEQMTLIKGLIEIDLTVCKFVQSAMMKSIINGCPVDQVKAPLKKLEAEITILEKLLKLYERTE